MPNEMTQEEMKARIIKAIENRRKRIKAERIKFDAETETMFPIIHKNHEERVNNV